MHNNKRTPSSRSRSLSFSPFEFALRLHRHLLRTSAFGVVFPLAGPSSGTHAVAAREGESRYADRAAVCLFGDVRTVGSTWPNGMQVGLDERNVDRWMQSHPGDQHFDAEQVPALRRDDHGYNPSTKGGRGTNAGSVQTFLYNALEPGGFDVFAVTLPRRPVWKYELFAPPPQGNEKQQSDENQLFLSHEQDYRVLFLDEDGAARADEGAAAQHLRTVPLVPHAVDADESNRHVCRFATPGTRPSSCFVAARDPRAAESIGTFEETPEDPKWATFMWTRASATWRSSVGMNKDIKICHNMLLAREAQSAFRYKYILRLRPDMVFLSQFPKLEALFPPRTSSKVSTEDADVASASPASSRNTIYVNSVTTYCCGNPDLFAVGLRETMQSCYTNMDEHWWRKNAWFDESDPLSWLYNRPGETAVKWSREDKKVVTLRWTPEDWKFALCEHFGVTMEPLDAINMTLLRPNVTGRIAKYIEVNSEKNGVLSRFRKAGEHAGREL